MKRTLLLLLASSSLARAHPTVYETLPGPDCSISVVGRATVVLDARGFFMGYYRPRRPPAPAFVPFKPRQTGAWQGVGQGHDSSFFGDSSGGSDYASYSDSYSGGDCGPSAASSNCDGGGGSQWASDSGSPLCSPDYGF